MSFYSPFAYIKSVSTIALDPDAQAFLTATGITDPTITSAINTLVISLKNDGVWTRMVAIYPFVGGTADTHKYNLKNPVDTNAGFRLTYSGGITHSANGIVGNGSTGYYDTYINASTDLSQNDVSVSTYVRNNVSGDQVDIGCINTVGTLVGLQLGVRDTAGIIVRINTGVIVSVTNSDSRGFFSINRTSATAAGVTKNTTQTNFAQNSIGVPNLSLWGLAINLNGSSAVAHTTRQQAFASAGQSLTDTQLDDYYTTVQAFQTTLGRQV